MFADQGAEEVRREVPSGKLVKSAIGEQHSELSERLQSPYHGLRHCVGGSRPARDKLTGLQVDPNGHF